MACIGTAYLVMVGKSSLFYSMSVSMFNGLSLFSSWINARGGVRIGGAWKELEIITIDENRTKARHQCVHACYFTSRAARHLQHVTLCSVTLCTNVLGRVTSDHDVSSARKHTHTHALARSRA